MAKILTQAALDALKPSMKRREIPDAKASGLYFVLQPSGKASWAYRYKSGRTSRKYTIGPYPLVSLAMARDKARKAAAERVDGIDPAVAKQAAKLTARSAAEPKLDLIETVVESFVKRYAQRQTREKTWRETERLLRREVISQFRGRRLSTVKRAEIHEMLDAIVDRGSPVTANRAFAALRKLCAWAVERGLIEANPCVGVRRPSKEASRERTLDDNELRALWQATAEIAYPFGPLVRLLVLTGARLREISEMRWSEVDQVKVWTLPAARSKNGVEHPVPLSDSALAILESLPRFEGCDYLFTVDGRRSVNGFNRWKRRLDALIAPATPFTLHDLRRSTASGMAGLGVPPHIVEAVLGHRGGVVSGIARIYNRFDYAAEKRAALQRWADHVERIASGASGANVVEFRGATLSTG